MADFNDELKSNSLDWWSGYLYNISIRVSDRYYSGFK